MRNIPSILFAAALGLGCGTTSTTSGTQTITGTISTTDAIAVRAITSGVIATAAEVHSDGSFTLSLPADASYRLELLTTSGVQPVLADSGTTFTDLQVKVCTPGNPVDMGHIGGHHHNGGGTMTPPPGCTPDASGTVGPNCPCDPTTGAMCGTGTPPPPPPGCTPDSSGNVGPNCPCDPTTGTMCGTGTGTGTMPPPSCTPDASGTVGPNCTPPPPPPCTDPTDMSTCQDPCMDDPTTCMCPSGNSDCWPTPTPPSCDASGANCMPPGGGDGMCPDHPPGDIGCS